MKKYARLIPFALAACVLLAYLPVLDYGLWFDDYMDVHPRSAGEIVRALSGHWSVEGWQDNYHRPLTALHSAWLFEIFGLNTVGLHAVSIAGVVVIALTLYGWVSRDGGRAIGVWVTVVYIWHPVLPNSTVAWVSNHKHIYAALLVASAMWLWSRRRTSVAWRAWWPMAVCAVLGFFFKEDTVMILPALVVLQTLRARVWDDVPRPSRTLILGVAGVLLVLAAVRWAMFPYAEALDLALTEERTWSDQLLASVYPAARALVVIRSAGEVVVSTTLFVGMLLLCGGWAAWRRPRGAASWLWTQGAVLACCFAVPLLLAPDFTTMRAHLMVLSASLMWAGGAVAFAESFSRRPAVQTAAVVALAVGFGALAQVTWMQVHTRFGPCGTESRQFDADVSAWPDSIIRADTKAWLQTKAQICDAGRTPKLWEEMDYVRWHTPNGIVALVTERASAVTMSVPTSGLVGNVVVLYEGREVGRGTAAGDLVLDVPLSRTLRSRLRASHRFDVVAQGPVTVALRTR